MSQQIKELIIEKQQEKIAIMLQTQLKTRTYRINYIEIWKFLNDKVNDKVLVLKKFNAGVINGVSTLF